MSGSAFLPGKRGVGSNAEAGMVHSVLSPYPNDIPILFTDFLDLNRIPKATITDKLFNIAQKLNFFKYNAATNTKTDTPLFNMGVNVNDQLFIKTELEDEVLGGANPPAILIDTNGDVYINGSTSSQTNGYLYVYDTTGITQYNRNTANIGPLGNWTDPTTGNERWDNIFYGSPIGAYAWNGVTIPVTTPSNQRILNQSPVPGSVNPGFTTFATQADPLPVDCVVHGEFFGVAPPPDGALLNNVGHTFSNVPITNNFTASYTLTVGIVRQIWNGAASPTPITNVLVARQDIDIPFRGTYTGTVASFSCNFNFNMTDTDPATGNPQSYVPFFNHNGIIYPATDANIRWRNVAVTFTTKANL
jgi:hypothetical protein